METSSGWFLSSPFRVDLVDPKHSTASPPIKYGSRCNEDTWLKHLEENLSLSWIVIDLKRKKAVNMSSKRAVEVQRHWMRGDVQVRFATVMEAGGDERWGSSREMVECGVVVTYGGEQQIIREVSMVMEDMEGKGISGEDSLVILKGVMESGRSNNIGGNKKKYEEFVKRKRERREVKERNDMVLELVWVITFVGAFAASWSLILFMF